MMTAAERRERIEKIRNFPAQLEALMQNLSEANLNTHFLEGEWTVAQNVHHVADSHMNAYIRLKLILTEDNPPLKGYNQDSWAVTADSHDLPVASSLALLKGLHARWCVLWESLGDADWSRSGTHSENVKMTPEDVLRTYSNHGDAHIDQINRTLAAKK
jgi:hypothetical protein